MDLVGLPPLKREKPVSEPFKTVFPIPFELIQESIDTE